jgi:hypothetical protein
MKEFLSSGVVGNIEYNAQKQIRESIQHRWDELGFTIDWASLLRI